MEAERDIEGEPMTPKTISLAAIDPKRSRFPCCIVWTPLPFISWFIPFIGHVGICREDGVILDFASPYFISVDDFAFGAVTRYLQLDISNSSSAWDEALKKSTRDFQHRSYNLFTCNCHSFVASSLNHLSYGGRNDWNMVNLAALIFFHGNYVDKKALIRSISTFFSLLFLGFLLSGFTFLVSWLIFSVALTGWFFFATYCSRNLIQL